MAKQLTAAQSAQSDRDGFLVFHDLLSPAEVAALKQDRVRGGPFPRQSRSRLATMHTHRVFALAFLARKMTRRPSANSFSATC
ncbi:MAG: hypothetical protein P4L66_01245 [Acetobacteraceae bacterium]|nr:hypothetical protein [Acetobacteraceae bacterium]